MLEIRVEGAELMRVLIACAIVISAALGLAGCFHPTSRCSGAVAANADQITNTGPVWLFPAILMLRLGWAILDRAPYIA